MARASPVKSASGSGILILKSSVEVVAAIPAAVFFLPDANLRAPAAALVTAGDRVGANWVERVDLGVAVPNRSRAGRAVRKVPVGLAAGWKERAEGLDMGTSEERNRLWAGVEPSVAPWDLRGVGLKSMMAVGRRADGRVLEREVVMTMSSRLRLGRGARPRVGGDKGQARTGGTG